MAPPLSPMLSRGADEIPSAGSWLYEPKWDGFRAVAFIDGDDVAITSRNTQPLLRFFPELAEPLRSALPKGGVLDGEIVMATAHGLDFDVLQNRLHPAASRVARLAVETPSTFVAFDILDDGGTDLRGLPLSERRARLKERLVVNDSVLLTPQTADVVVAREWYVRFEGAGLDGLVAKSPTGIYEPGARGWTKIKHLRTVDTVVGGYRLDAAGTGVGSLLLGLHDSDGTLHYVGHTSGMSARERRDVLARLAEIPGESFGGGRSPGGESRWSKGKDSSFVSVRPELVVEVRFDHMQGPRMRHAAGIERWRPDKDPRECTFDQLSSLDDFDLHEVLRGWHRPG